MEATMMHVKKMARVLAPVGAVLLGIAVLSALLNRGGDEPTPEEIPDEGQVEAETEEETTPEEEEEIEEDVKEEDAEAEEETPAEEEEEETTPPPTPPDEETAKDALADAAPVPPTEEAKEIEAPPEPPTLNQFGIGDYDIKFATDAALGENLQGARVWAFACSPSGTVYLVTPMFAEKDGSAVRCEWLCDTDGRARNGMRELEYPTPALLSTLNVSDVAAYKWYVTVDRGLATQITDALAEANVNPDTRPLVEIRGDGTVELLRRGRRGRR